MPDVRVTSAVTTGGEACGADHAGIRRTVRTVADQIVPWATRGAADTEGVASGQQADPPGEPLDDPFIGPAGRLGEQVTIDDLSHDDIKLLAEIASGATGDVVARHLELSSRTLRRRLRLICDQLGVSTPIEAVVWAARNQLI